MEPENRERRNMKGYTRRDKRYWKNGRKREYLITCKPQRWKEKERERLSREREGKEEKLIKRRKEEVKNKEERGERRNG